MRNLFLVLILSISGLCGKMEAQSVEVVKFDALSPYLEPENDTLYVLNFWATWCRPCVAELPHFEKVREENQELPVKFVYVSLDFAEDLEKKVITFLKRKPLGGEVLLLDEVNYNTWLGKISEEWSGAIPATLFINSSKGIRKFHEGDYTYESLNAEFQQLISQ